MTGHNLFPHRIETDRLVFERLAHDTVDLFECYEFVTSDEWQGDATEHMPWFRFQRLDELSGFVDQAEQQWADGQLPTSKLMGLSVGLPSFALPHESPTPQTF